MQRLNRVLAAAAVVCTIGAAQRAIGAGPVGAVPVRPKRPRQHHRRRQRRPRRADCRGHGLRARHGHRGQGDHRRLGMVLDRRAADRRLHAAGAPHRLPRLGARDGSRERPSAGACSAFSSAGSNGPVATSRDARLPFPRGRSWPPASGCPPGRSPISPTRRKRRRTRSRATIIRTTKRRGGFATSSAASSRTRRRSSPSSSATARSTPGSLFGRAMDSAASLATTFFTDLPFSGEVNLLTTGALRTGRAVLGRRAAARRRLHGDRRADAGRRLVGARGDESGRSVVVDRGRRVPVPRRDRARLQVRLLVQRAGLSRRESRRARRRHRRQPQRRRAVRARSRGRSRRRSRSNTAAATAATTICGPAASSARRVGLTVEPLKNTRVSAIVAQRMVAPGAEEFVASETPGPWLPPERTFAPLGGPGARQRVQRRARALRRPDGRARVRRELRGRPPPLLSERRRSAGHALRPERARRAAVGRPLLRRQRRIARRRWLGAAPQQRGQARDAARSTTA